MGHELASTRFWANSLAAWRRKNTSKDIIRSSSGTDWPLKVVNNKNNSLSIIGYRDIKLVVGRTTIWVSWRQHQQRQQRQQSGCCLVQSQRMRRAYDACRPSRVTRCYFCERRRTASAAAAAADTAGWQQTEHLLPLEAPIAYLAGRPRLLPSVAEAAAAENRTSAAGAFWTVGAGIVSAASKTGQTSIGGGERVRVVTDGRRVCLSVCLSVRSPAHDQ